MWWWVFTWLLCTLFFLMGYVLGQSFRRYRQEEEEQERAHIFFLCGFFRAWGVNIRSRSEIDAGAAQEPAERGAS